MESSRERRKKEGLPTMTDQFFFLSFFYYELIIFFSILYS